ncbi:hypothetical protein ACQEV9_25000 [Streptomyces chartreusis]|uniref:hypothetical protein n=1 Tax=Streptomyces chartreusis TaxID=1969 RepID=UPI003D8E2EBA
MSNAELNDVSFLEVHASHVDVEGTSSNDDPAGESTMKVWYRAEGQQIQVRCRLDLQSSDARFVADAVADFSVTGELPTDDAIREAFTQRIGVAVVYPYLRESVHGMAQKIGVDIPILSLIAHKLKEIRSPIGDSQGAPQIAGQ